MSCEEFQAILESLDDDEAGNQGTALGEHLRSCSTCAAALEDARRLRGLLRRSGVEEAPERAKLRALVAVARAAAATRGNPPAVLTLAEVAEYLRVREEEVRRMVHRIPHFVVGDQLRFRRQSLEEWIEREEKRQSASVFTSPALTLLGDDAPAWPLAG